MKLKRINANSRELIFNDGSKLLISYDTPVAFWLNKHNGIIFETAEKWSNSTTRQIQKWKNKHGYPDTFLVQQNFFNSLLDDTGLEDKIGQWKTLSSHTFPVGEFNKKMRGKS